VSDLAGITWADGRFGSIVRDGDGVVLHFSDHAGTDHALRFDGALWVEVGPGWGDEVASYTVLNDSAEIVRANAELIAAGGAARDDLVLIRFFGATLPHVPIVALIY
jgi:hypothetical protein